MELPRKFVQQSSLLEKRASLRVQTESNSAAVWGRGKRRIAIALAALLCAMIVWSSETLFAQTPTASPTRPQLRPPNPTA